MSILVEIEGVFNITNRGKYVAVKLLNPGHNFYITDNSSLGDVPLDKFLEMPKASDENGNQRYDLIVLKLKNPGDAVKLAINSIVELFP